MKINGKMIDQVCQIDSLYKIKSFCSGDVKRVPGGFVCIIGLKGGDVLVA